MNETLHVEWKPNGHNRTGTLTVRLNDRPLYTDEGNLSKETFRQRAVDRICQNRPAIDRTALEKELCRLAVEASERNEAGPVEYREEPRIVRPERFILPQVSGMTCPVTTVIDGRPAGKWVLYLRWADGRREGIDLPEYLDLENNHRLWFYPDPSLPDPGTRPGWSALSRRAWLEGTAAPDPADLFQRLCLQMAYFIDLPKDRAAGLLGTLGLWSILSYSYPAWDAVPYLNIGGPLGSGKSRTFEILERVCFRAVSSSSISGPCLFRSLHDRGGTLLVDEAERLKSENPETQELLSMLLAGYKRGGKATRLEVVGKTFKPACFEVYGPKALACIAGLPPALASRCIPMTMFRAGPESEKPRRRIDADPAAWQRLRDDLHVLALEHGPVWLELSGRSGVCPPMSGRNYELWQPLLALAQWLDEAGAKGLLDLMTRHALDVIDAAQEDQTPDADETLLRVFAELVLSLSAPTPSDILRRIQGLDEHLFGKWISRTVSNRLRQYGIPSPQKSTHGRRVYNNVSRDLLYRIQKHYRMDLGLSPPEPPPPPGISGTDKTGTLIGTGAVAGGGSGDSGERQG